MSDDIGIILTVFTSYKRNFCKNFRQRCFNRQRFAVDILKAHKNGLRGVMHCYSGSVETAYECLDLGLAFSFGGAVTFKNAKKPIEVIEKLPLESILLETDCPYMTPVPYRGRRNDPSFIGLVAEKIAEIRGMSAEELSEVTFNNANRVFEMEE